MSDSLKLCLPATIGVSRILSMSVYAPSKRTKTCAPCVSTDPAGVTAFCRESRKDVRWRDAQRCQPRIGKLDKYPLLLFPYDIHLLDSRHVEKSLPEFFGDASQFAERETGSLHRVKCK